MASAASFEFWGLINNFTLGHILAIFCSFKFCDEMATFFYMLTLIVTEAECLKVIPVIDVLNGFTVHAVKGKRKEYRPLKTVLTDSSDPIKVALTFKTLGFSELYLADLDAILGKQPNLHLYSQIARKTGLKLMVDAGVTDNKTAKTLLDNGVEKVIVGTETLKTRTFIQNAIRQFGKDRIVVSLDLKDNQVLTNPDFDGSTDPLKLLGELREMGVSDFIVLDLTRVGSEEGVNTAFLKEALMLLGGGVYVGGGVRNIEDLTELKTLGVSGVLLATALHTGKIRFADLKKAALF
jgi:phosphoribosylformimino-5-aminoimidazole carboxamide ribotide isomerase